VNLDDFNERVAVRLWMWIGVSGNLISSALVQDKADQAVYGTPRLESGAGSRIPDVD
jgi:hypothetical protein